MSQVNVSGNLQVHDCTFSNPEHPTSRNGIAIQHRSGPDYGYWPLLISNSTVSSTGAGIYLRDPEDTDPRNMTYSLPAGHCPATGIDSSTQFLKSDWPVPTKVLEYVDFLPALNGSKPSPEQVTATVQACVDAAAAAGNGATAYFPKGTYVLTATINVIGQKGKFFYVGGSS